MGIALYAAKGRIGELMAALTALGLEPVWAEEAYAGNTRLARVTLPGSLVMTYGLDIDGQWTLAKVEDTQPSAVEMSFSPSSN